MRTQFRTAAAFVCIAIAAAQAAQSAYAGTWENEFGEQNLNFIIEHLRQERDSDRRRAIERQIASALEQDDARARYVMGVLQVEGLPPEIPQAPADGVQQIEAAAQRGVQEAPLELAALVYLGYQSVDQRRTREWLDELADTDGTDAYADARMWADGKGGQRDACRAHLLLLVAQQQNVNPDGRLAQRLTQTQAGCNRQRGGTRVAIGSDITPDEWAAIRALRDAPTAIPRSASSGVTPPVGAAATSGANPAAPVVLPPQDAGAAQAQGGVSIGVPADIGTRDLDKLLALLAYAVYSDPEKLTAAQKAANDLQSKLDRIENDTRRDSLIKLREVKALDEAVEAANRKIAELQDQENIKVTIEQMYGARRVRLAGIEKMAAAGHVYFENYALPDGRQIIVFRGTANGTDVITDLQIGLTPALAHELAARVKLMQGQAMMTGISDVAVKGYYDAGHFDSADLGRPHAFRVADEVVRQISRGGAPAGQLILSGHSLGGGYAQYAGFRNHVAQIVTFNPAPLSGQLQQDAGVAQGSFAGQVRHYVSFISLADSRSGGYYDPVSQLMNEYLHQPEIASLRVIGQEYAVPVCTDLWSPEYEAFSRSLQKQITQKTLNSIDKGGKLATKAGKMIGEIEGYSNATTERKSAFKAGGEVGQIPGKVLGTASYCTKHPYLCGGRLALGGIASAVTLHEIAPRAWTLFSAHRMKNLEEAIQRDGVSQCVDPMAQVTGRQ